MRIFLVKILSGYSAYFNMCLRDGIAVWRSGRVLSRDDCSCTEHNIRQNKYDFYLSLRLKRGGNKLVGTSCFLCVSVVRQFKVLKHQARYRNTEYGTIYILYWKKLRTKIFPATLFNFVIIRLKYSSSHVKEVGGSIFLLSHVYKFIFLSLFLFRVLDRPSCLSDISGKLLPISHLNILVYSKRFIQHFCLEVLHALYRDLFLNDPRYQLHFNPRDDKRSNDRRYSISPSVGFGAF